MIVLTSSSDSWGRHGVSLPRPEGERVGRGGHDDSVSHRRSPLYLLDVREPVCIVDWPNGPTCRELPIAPVPRAPDEDLCPGRAAATYVQWEVCAESASTGIDARRGGPTCIGDWS